MSISLRQNVNFIKKYFKKREISIILKNIDNSEIN